MGKFVWPPIGELAICPKPPVSDVLDALFKGCPICPGHGVCVCVCVFLFKGTWLLLFWCPTQKRNSEPRMPWKNHDPAAKGLGGGVASEQTRLQKGLGGSCIRLQLLVETPIFIRVDEPRISISSAASGKCCLREKGHMPMSKLTLESKVQGVRTSPRHFLPCP